MRVKEIDILNKLLLFGIPGNLSGSRYLRTAIRLAIENPGYNNQITTKVYPAIAKKYDVKRGQVERAIRVAVEKGFDNASKEIYEYLGNTANPLTGKTPNAAFIFSISEKMACEAREELHGYTTEE